MLTRELLTRHAANPIVTHKSLPFNCNAVYNPGATRFRGRYVLLPRVEDGRRDNTLHVAWSDDGIRFDVEPKPIRIINELPDELPEKHLYDARITGLEGTYYVSYCSQDFGEVVRIGLLRTDDFREFHRIAFITEPWNRNCALFPKRIGGAYVRVDRPMSGNDVINVVSSSPDLVHWGGSKPIILKDQTWMRQKWGIGPPPLETPEGWLVIIHGVWLAVNYVYRLGVILLDLEKPWKVIGQCPEFILTPREPYERVGDTMNCVFANGAIAEPDGTIKVYYGAADSCIGLATGNIEELVTACRSSKR